jgi:hypothetical protein
MRGTLEPYGAITEADLDLLHVTDDTDEAVEFIRSFGAEPPLSEEIEAELR